MNRLNLLFSVLLGLFCLLSTDLIGQQRPQGQGRPGGPGGRQMNPRFLSGVVTDADQLPIPYASVAVYKMRDSTLLTGGATDDNGKFRIKARPGNFYLKVSFLSYEEKIVPGIKIRQEDLTVPPIRLESGSQELGEVEIAAEKSQMELMLDKRVFNIGKDLQNVGSSAAEVLDNLPSVEVDVDGNVSLRGSQNVRILVDGKPSGLVGVSGSDALRQLQGDLVERVEVVTNPSARYDAEGEVGIINIVLKKEKRKGYNGSIVLNTGVPHNHGVSLNLNWRKKKLNYFAGYGFRFRENPGSGYSDQRFFGDSTFSYLREREHLRGGYAHNARAGLDYSFSKTATITASALYKNSDGDNTAKLTYKDFNSADELTQTVVRDEEEEESDEVIELALRWRKTFKKKGQEWTADVTFMDNDDIENALIRETSDQAGVADIDQRVSNTENQQRWLIQSDYVHPMGKHGKFETGFRFTLTDIENDYTVEELNESGAWEPLPDFDNEFLYAENIYAAYVMYGNKVGGFSYQGGLRMEHSDIRTELLQTNEVNPRNYTNLFPSFHFSYEFDKANSVQWSYSRRLSRPRFRQLIPFFGFADSRNFFGGNPDLNPEFTNSFEVGYLKRWEQGSILSSIYYRHRTDVFNWFTEADSTGFIRTYPINLGTQNNFGFEFSGSHALAKWWKLNGSFNLFRAITDGAGENSDLNADTYTWQTRGVSRWSLDKKTDLQASIRYRAPRETPQGRSLSMYNFDLGLSRQVLKGKGTLSLSGRDIFNTRKRRSETTGPNFTSESEFQWRARTFRVSFTYRINQQNRRGNRDRSRSGGSGFSEGDDMDF